MVTSVGELSLTNLVSRPWFSDPTLESTESEHVDLPGEGGSLRAWHPYCSAQGWPRRHTTALAEGVGLRWLCLVEHEPPNFSALPQPSDPGVELSELANTNKSAQLNLKLRKRIDPLFFNVSISHEPLGYANAKFLFPIYQEDLPSGSLFLRSHSPSLFSSQTTLPTTK